MACFRSHEHATRGNESRRKRPKTEPTDDWELLLPLFAWPEQQTQGELRPLALFGGSVAKRARETGAPGRTIYRRVARFQDDGIFGLFAVWTACDSGAVRFLIWDFDGTFAYHWRGLWSGSMLYCLEQAAPGLGVGRKDLRPYLQAGFPWHDPELAHPDLDTPTKWWDALFPVLERAYTAVGVPVGLARELPARVREDFVDPAQWRAFPGVFPALDELSTRGWTPLVLSNHVPELSDIAWGRGLGDRISRVFNSAQTDYEKPHPEAYRQVLLAIGDGDEAEDAWMIGDSMRADVVGAESAGIPAILVRSYHPDAERRCDDLHGVIGILEDEQR